MDRVGSINKGVVLYDNEGIPPVNEDLVENTLGQKRYELKNHLGTVNVTVSDRKVFNTDDNYYEALVMSYVETYAFGMFRDACFSSNEKLSRTNPDKAREVADGLSGLMPGRSFNADGQRFLYHGMEHDLEVLGNGNSYTTEFRQYSLSRCMFSRFLIENRSKTIIGNPRLGRWKSLDPLMSMFPHMSPYVGFANNPIFFVDPYGLAPHGGGGDDIPETHTLKEGENMYRTALKYGIEPQDLYDLNPELYENRKNLKPGTIILLRKPVPQEEQISSEPFDMSLVVFELPEVDYNNGERNESTGSGNSNTKRSYETPVDITTSIGTLDVNTGFGGLGGSGSVSSFSVPKDAPVLEAGRRVIFLSASVGASMPGADVGMGAGSIQFNKVKDHSINTTMTETESASFQGGFISPFGVGLKYYNMYSPGYWHSHQGMIAFGTPGIIAGVSHSDLGGTIIKVSPQLTRRDSITNWIRIYRDFGNGGDRLLNFGIDTNTLISPSSY